MFAKKQHEHGLKIIKGNRNRMKLIETDLNKMKLYLMKDNES